MREVEHLYTVERLAGLPPKFGRGLRQSRRERFLCRRLSDLQLHDLLRCRPRFGLGSGFHSLARCHSRFLSGIGGTIYFLRSLLCGLRLPMRPLSLPAAGSITALMRVGLPESIAALTARFSSSGEVALTPTPPNASIILS